MTTNAPATRTDPITTLRLYLCWLAGLLAAAPLHAADGVDAVGERLERPLMARLAEVQQAPGNRLAPFTTDGCSGGLSVGWEHMGRLFPRLGALVGNSPPWEACCVSHDRSYWQGMGGFDGRLAADQALRQCVIDSAAQHAPQLAARLQLSTERVAPAFTVAADLMYAAVRVGGVPCSALPWRWGYGWPQCTPLAVPATNTPQTAPSL